MHLTAVVVALLFVPTILSQQDVENYLQRYAYRKLWSSCVGEQLTDQWDNMILQAVRQCSPSGFDQGSFSNFPSFTTTGVPLFTSTQGTQFTTTRRGGVIGGGFASQGLLGLQDNQQQPIVFAVLDSVSVPSSGGSLFNSLDHRVSASGFGSGRRTKRGFEVELDGLNLREAESRLLSRAENFTCILQALNLVDQRFELRWDQMGRALSNAPLQSEFKSDLFEILEECKRMTSCSASRSRRNRVLPDHVERNIMALKCAQMKKRMACLKHDLRLHLARSSGIRNREDIVDRVLDVLISKNSAVDHLSLFE